MHRNDRYTTAQRATGAFHAERCLLAFAGTAICGWALSLAWLWAA
jgi:hypothetical protein